MIARSANAETPSRTNNQEFEPNRPFSSCTTVPARRVRPLLASESLRTSDTRDAKGRSVTARAGAGCAAAIAVVETTRDAAAALSMSFLNVTAKFP
ncbi:hypothetical protein ACFSGX_02210 [Sphingomonas arantia]|uniref:Uncharacterized protein n=1 Tax=Sphingomonas arantia TaxID=1460676 RepID=A0ABW4TVY1_9SPHN